MEKPNAQREGTNERAGRAGGLARKAALTDEQRREIASKAARARWHDPGAKIPKATHLGVLTIGPVEIPCAVLEDGRRVLTAAGVQVAVGRAGNARVGIGEIPFDLPPFLAAKNLTPFISEELRNSSKPIVFSPITPSGQRARNAVGYPAQILPDICAVFVDAKDNQKLHARQEEMYQRSKALMRAFAKVGIVALVDEATGYQADRAADDLRRLLEQYIAEEMRPWMQTFPTEFFKQVYRLHGWTYTPGDTRTPRYVGKFIDHYIYKPLPTKVRDTLRERNPVVNGRRKHKHFQFLTEDVGNPHLSEQIRAVTILMKGADNKAAFKRAFTRVFAPDGQQELLLEGPDRPAAELASSQDEVPTK